MSDQGLSPDLQASQDKSEATIQEGVDGLHQSVGEGGVIDMIKATGEAITAAGHAAGEFGNGLGEQLETGVQRPFGSQEFGSSLLGEFGEASMSILGEGAEMFAEATGALVEGPIVAFGGAVEHGGGLIENVIDGGAELFTGNVGEAFEHFGDAIGDAVALGGSLAEAPLGLVYAGAEVVEGVGAIAWEVGEGAAEMVVGAGRDLYDGGAWVGGNVADAAGAVAEEVSGVTDWLTASVTDFADDIYDAAAAESE